MFRTPSKPVMQTAAWIICILAVAIPSYAQRIAGFSVERGGYYALSGGPGLALLRQAIQSAFPDATIRGITSITEASPASDDLLFLLVTSANNGAITPLTSEEQASLLAFVQAGKSALIFADNDSFADGASDPANESLLDPFGLDCSGFQFGGGASGVVPDPASSPVTDGDFGTITTFGIFFYGWFDNLGSHANVVAVAAENGQPILAVVPCGALAPGSGPVVLFSDCTMIAEPWMTISDTNLVLNAIDFARAGCRLPGDVDLDGDVDLADLTSLLSAFGSCSGDATFNPQADFDQSGCVDLNDLAVLLANFGA